MAATDTTKMCYTCIMYFEGGMKNQAIKNFCLELLTFEIISFHKALFRPVYHLTIIVFLTLVVQACFLCTFEKTQGQNNSMFLPLAKNSRIFSPKTQSYEAQSETWWYRILALKL